MKLQWICSCRLYRLLGSTYDPAALIHFYVCSAVAAAATTLPQSAAAYIGALFAAPVASWHRICCCTPLAPSPRHHTCTLSHLQIESTHYHNCRNREYHNCRFFTCRLSQLQNMSTLQKFTTAPHNINIISRTTATCAHYHTYTIVHLNISAHHMYSWKVLCCCTHEK